MTPLCPLIPAKAGTHFHPRGLQFNPEALAIRRMDPGIRRDER
jgi:hypothetical protein